MNTVNRINEIKEKIRVHGSNRALIFSLAKQFERIQEEYNELSAKFNPKVACELIEKKIRAKAISFCNFDKAAQLQEALKEWDSIVYQINFKPVMYPVMLIVRMQEMLNDSDWGVFADRFSMFWETKGVNFWFAYNFYKNNIGKK